MTREEAIKIIKECKEKGFKHTFYTVNEYDTALDMAIKALEQEPCEDCISRQAAIDYCYQLINVEHQQGSDEMNYGQERINQTETILHHLEFMPSAQPEIIRCKDCKHYQFVDNRAFGMPVKMCEWFGFEDVDDDDFCSRAERKTG